MRFLDSSALVAWALGGALAASLSWNWTQYREAETHLECALPSSVCGLVAPDLDPECQSSLSAVCASSCTEADRLGAEADALQERLLASLAAPEVDPQAAEALAERIGDLRRRSLEACVRGILEVRRVLSPDEVQALLSCCSSEQH